MESPRENIELFLSHHKFAEGQRLPAAIVFADSMLVELAAAVAEWQKMAAELQRLKRGMASPCTN
jgi:hypothetical protein